MGTLNQLRVRCTVLLACLAAGAIAVPGARAGTFEVYPQCALATYSAGGDMSSYCQGGTFIINAPLGRVPAGTSPSWVIHAPPGITITHVGMPTIAVFNANNNEGWGGGDFWPGGGEEWTPSTTAVNAFLAANSFGVWMVCGQTTCTNPGSMQVVNGWSIQASESQGPGLIAIGANNLWYQSSHWIWNPPGDPWPLTLEASDVSGVCNVWAYVNASNELQGPTARPNTSQ